MTDKNKFMKEFEINHVKLECYPLSTAQKIHNFSRMVCPYQQLLNIGTGLYLQMEIDFDIMREAIYLAYERQDALRIRFMQDENGDVYQYLVPFENREIKLVDFSNWREEDVENELQRWTGTPLGRFHAPLNEIVMVRMPNGYNGVYIKVDHMTMDSSSIILLYADILQLYSAKRYGMNMPKPMMPYLDQLAKDLEYEAHSPARQRDEKYWMEDIMKSEPMYTDFNGMGRLITQRRENNNPNQRSAKIASNSPLAAISVFQLEKEPSDRLAKFCADNDVPMVCLLFMGIRTVLSKFNNNETDVSIKSCVSRRGTLSEKRSGGTRVHFFPLRTIMEPDVTFLEGIRMIQEEQNRIFRHANYDPVEQMMQRVKYWKEPQGTGYESISLTYQPMTLSNYDVKMPEIPYKSRWYTNGVAAQPLYLTVMHRVEDNGLNFNFEYQKEAVTDYEMEYFYYYLCRVLFRGIENGNRTIGDILEMI